MHTTVIRFIIIFLKTVNTLYEDYKNMIVNLNDNCANILIKITKDEEMYDLKDNCILDVC
jgi:hypothetical protein